MKYISTRGEAPSLNFEDVLLTGLASDGGLYVPQCWPALPCSDGTDSGAWVRSLAGRSYDDVAFEVCRPFLEDELPEPELRAILRDAYATFRHPAVAPLVQIGPDDWILELFHGPTLAFKDVAMQVLARLMDRALRRRGRRATIVGATSGDTGGAAIDAFRGRDAVDVFILFPHGRVSDVQRRQMTTAPDENVHAIAVEGTFDDCQALVKALFADAALRDRLQLAAVNSINWARIMAQTVYYFTAAVALGAPGRRVSFSVPTGNFGDIFAGYVAMRMGLPIGRLIIATNVNDILARTLEHGRYEPKGVVASLSPSMDIQISSNFERLLFEITGRDSARVRHLMSGLSRNGGFRLNEGERGQLAATFAAHSVTEPETLRTIASLRHATGYLADPHTAVGIRAAAVARESGLSGREQGVMITLATAHPAKFPDAVEKATGMRPSEPEVIARQRSLDERLSVLPNDYAAVVKFIADRARARRHTTA